MILKGVVFLAGWTCRSQAYAQAMLRAGLAPEHTILFGSPKKALPGQARTGFKNHKGVMGLLFLPDLNIPLKRTYDEGAWPLVFEESSDVNSGAVISKIKNLHPRLVIYSGYGGQRVKEGMLSLNIPFLHIHGGWLPDYRGSTTLYYSWLEKGECGASAILLKKEIDKGPVVQRRRYPLPPRGVDPDYIYDPAIRADLLVRILKIYAKRKKLPFAKPQSSRGKTFYVIHPVLKHLARLSQWKNKK